MIIQTHMIHLSLFEQIVVEAYSLKTLSKFIAILAIPPSSPLYLYEALLFGGELVAQKDW